MKSSGKVGDIAYIFESGHEFQADANKLISGFVGNDFIRSGYRYRSHAFVPKSAGMRPMMMKLFDLLGLPDKTQTIRRQA